MKLHETTVRTQDVRKGFGDGSSRLEVLRGVNLDAHAGEMLLLVGPSGCGKTTLLCLIAGLLDPDAGSISLFGTDIGRLTEKECTEFRQEHIGFVFQQFNLLPTLTAQENAAVPLLIRGENRRRALSKAGEMLERVGLKHRMHARPSKLSGGEQQRVAIARALAAEPKLLVCDEPTASLDGETGAHVMELLREVSLDGNKRTVLVVTHDSRIFRFGDRIAHVGDGRIVKVEPVTKPAREDIALLRTA
ncbi:MAG TPA: ABC transporter ATP-binding protein [Planctomycetota bacterium]|nr:ABC transporter ATP-binding protein [Planctomycetota bacterium]